jgi:phospholipid-binding lipoprotein MlaA
MLCRLAVAAVATAVAIAGASDLCASENAAAAPTKATAAPAEWTDSELPPRVSDPLQGVNRAMFGMNHQLYRFTLRPVAKGYKRAVPQPLQRGLANFFDNIRFPIRFTGALLQGKGGRATREAGRFAVNTVGGLGGFFKPADKIPVLTAEPTEDLGQVLAVWGCGAGPFLVLPLLGPTTLRDLIGSAGDTALTPTSWTFKGYDEWETQFAVHASDFIQQTPGLLVRYDAARAGALDPYIAVREAYAAQRAEENKQ